MRAHDYEVVQIKFFSVPFILSARYLLCRYLKSCSKESQYANVLPRYSESLIFTTLKISLAAQCAIKVIRVRVYYEDILGG